VPRPRTRKRRVEGFEFGPLVRHAGQASHCPIYSYGGKWQTFWPVSLGISPRRAWLAMCSNSQFRSYFPMADAHSVWDNLRRPRFACTDVTFSNRAGSYTRSSPPGVNVVQLGAKRACCLVRSVAGCPARRLVDIPIYRKGGPRGSEDLVRVTVPAHP